MGLSEAPSFSQCNWGVTETFPNLEIIWSLDHLAMLVFLQRVPSFFGALNSAVLGEPFLNRVNFCPSLPRFVTVVATIPKTSIPAVCLLVVPKRNIIKFLSKLWY